MPITRTTDRKCACGNRLYGPNRRCQQCQAAYNAIKVAARSERAPKLPRHGPREDPNRNPDHLAWIRSLPCAVSGAQGPSEAAHVRIGTGGGMGLKPPDSWTVPLHWKLHAEQHRIGHRAFDERYGVNLRDLAERYAAKSPFLKLR